MASSRTVLLIERIGLLLHNLGRQSAVLQGLQPVHVLALDYLSRCNRYSDTPLATAHYLQSTKGTVSQSLRLLEQRGLLRRKADRNDGRVVHLRLTSRGRRVLDQCRPLIAGLPAGCEDESQIVEQALESLLHDLQRENGLRTFGQCRTCRHLLREQGRFRCDLTGERLRPVETSQICHEHEFAEPKAS